MSHPGRLPRLLIWLLLVAVHTASFAQVVRPIVWEGCAVRVQDMAQAMQVLREPATRAALGPQVADRLLQRQAADLGRAVESLQWGVEHEASSRQIVQTALAVGATLAGGKDCIKQSFGTGLPTSQNPVDNNYLSTQDVTWA